MLSKTIEAGNKQIAITSATPFFSGAVVKQSRASDDLPGELGINNQTSGMAVPLVARQGAMYMNPNNPLYGNRPSIQIVQLASTAGNGSNNTIVKTFDHLILGNVQVGDAEKTDVHETFGAPYFFASGRFVRRVTFSGFVRATPINAQASGGQNAVYRVTQYALFRLFYENYLRISIQALKGWFTRITVDREVFEGFVTTFNCTQQAETETTVPFTFTMFCTNQRNDALDSDAMKVLESGQSSGSTQPTMNAQAEVNDAIVVPALSANPSITDLGILTFNNPVPYGVAQNPVHLAFDPRPEFLTVRANLPGIEAVYDASVFGGSKKGVPVHGTVPPVSGSFPIDFKITDYWVLYNALLAQKQTQTRLLSAGTVTPMSTGQINLLPGAAKFSIISASQQKIEVTVHFQLTPPENVVVQSVRPIFNNMNFGGGTPIPPGAIGTELVIEQDKAGMLMASSNSVSAQLRYFLGTPDGSPVPPDALNGATVVYDIQEVYPALGEALIRVENQEDLDICNKAMMLNNSLTAVPEENSFYNVFGVFFNTLLDMRNVNPFLEADRVVIRMRPTITMAAYPKQLLPTLTMVITVGEPALRTSLKKLDFIGAVWAPVQAPVIETGDVRQERLDQFGLLKFVIQTANTNDVADSIYAAIKKGSLTIATRFASQVQGSCRIDPIPMNGTQYGTGELLDPDTGKRVFLRTKMQNLQYSDSLRALTFEIVVNTTYYSGVTAYLYSARFWDYISDVISASLNLPTSTSIVSPGTWAK